MKNISITLCAVLSCLCLGCVVIPVPTKEHTPTGFNTRGEIDAAAVAFIQVGSTSKEEVLLKLGEPDGVWKDERYFLYRWTSVRGGYLIWIAADPNAGNSGIGGATLERERYDLLIEFDNRGVVRRIGDIARWAARIEGQNDSPLDLSAPIRISVTHQHGLGSDKIASLILGKEFFGLAEYKSSHNFRIAPEKIIGISTEKISLLDAASGDAQWSKGELSHEIQFSEETAAGNRIRVTVHHFLSSIILLEYLRQNCPNLTVANEK